jgi:hypothetical protein
MLLTNLGPFFLTENRLFTPAGPKNVSPTGSIYPGFANETVWREEKSASRGQP